MYLLLNIPISTFVEAIEISEGMLSENEMSARVVLSLEALLKPVPFVSGMEWIWEQELPKVARADFIAILSVAGKEFQLVGEIKKKLQPRQAYDAIRQVKEHIFHLSSRTAYPLLVSDYISPRTAEILVEQNVSYLDLAGNCRLSFASVYIEKTGKKPKSVAQRGVKSLFGMKSSRMLRLMLNQPTHPWQVKNLATKADLSFGQVSNIRRALLDQQYAVESEEGGIELIQPGDLLHDWQKLYKKNLIDGSSGYYTLLSEDEKQKAVEAAFLEAQENGAEIVFSGLSAARWLAPYARVLSERFYADKLGHEILRKHLQLKAVESGPNVIIEEPKDHYLFEEAIKCGPNFKCTGEIQTYLDLCIAGEREQEAAEHLESQVLRHKWLDDSGAG